MRMATVTAALALLAAACSGDDAVQTSVPPAVTPRVVPTEPSAPPPAASATTMVPSTGATAPASPATTPVTSTPAPPAAPTTTSPPSVTVPIDQLRLALQPVAEGFAQPVLALAPRDDGRLFVVDQPGRIWVITAGEATVFLDIRSAVRFRGEQGLLGMAFHPDYASNGLFYVNFTDTRGATVVAEFSADPDDPSQARPGSRRDVLLVSQPAANHNGGMIAFGPDGLLWIGMGDGGGANDRYRNGQRADRRLGSLLRIEVGPGADEPYGDPDETPFLEAGGLPEVWAIGLRNPWRFSFDDGFLYLADVGQNQTEEVNVVPADLGGVNYGWPITEGDDCFRTTGCDTSGLQPPVYTYSHSDGCSVTGGFVYRGAALPELAGHYFLGDFCSGWIRSLVVVDGELVTEHEWFDGGSVPGITSFGTDAAGELYVASTNGTVYRIVRAS